MGFALSACCTLSISYFALPSNIRNGTNLRINLSPYFCQVAVSELALIDYRTNIHNIQDGICPIFSIDHTLLWVKSLAL
jgi:hypothetical protein